MSNINSDTSRRAFFLRGGAVLGAGVASTAGATAMVSGSETSGADLKKLQAQLGSMTDCEAIRQVHQAFALMIEGQTYDAAADLFVDDASVDLSGVSAKGRSAIVQLFADGYCHQKATAMHSAYRQGDRSKDIVALSNDGKRATATFHVDVAVTTPLEGDFTVATMARLQGQTATRRWESGRLEAQYVKARGQWKIASLNYVIS